MDIIKELKKKKINVIEITEVYSARILAEKLEAIVQDKETFKLLEDNGLFLKNFLSLLSYLYLSVHAKKITSSDSDQVNISSHLFNKSFLSKLNILNESSFLYN